MKFHFAELNIARLLQPLDHADNAEFVAVLDAVNAIAEVSDGFVWRLKDDDGRSASYVTVYDDPQLIVNLSVWESPDALKHFVYRSGHSAYLRRRKEWFGEPAPIQMVCWWIPAGETPDVHDAARRLEHLRTHGPSAEGFAFADAADWPAGTVER
jgi:heme-degrading monooxygenase HmoA